MKKLMHIQVSGYDSGHIPDQKYVDGVKELFAAALDNSIAIVVTRPGITASILEYDDKPVKQKRNKKRKAK